MKAVLSLRGAGVETACLGTARAPREKGLVPGAERAPTASRLLQPSEQRQAWGGGLFCGRRVFFLSGPLRSPRARWQSLERWERSPPARLGTAWLGSLCPEREGGGAGDCKQGRALLREKHNARSHLAPHSCPDGAAV